MMKAVDISGKIFNYWTVISYAGHEKWNCKCRCGKEKSVSRGSLKNGRSKSCGCYHSPNKIDYNEKTKKRLLLYVHFNENGCWDWLGGKTNKGYGQTTYRNERCWVASRVSYLIWNGEIPNNMFVCHACDRTICINPKHLFLGTHEDNMKDMKLKGRACKGENSHLHKKNRKTI